MSDQCFGSTSKMSKIETMTNIVDQLALHRFEKCYLNLILTKLDNLSVDL